MTIASFDTVIYTCLFIVPGYIIQEVIASILPRKNCLIGEKVVQAIGYSVLNFVIWYWLFLAVQQKLQEYFYFYWVCNTVVTIITSLITGTILGLLRINNVFGKFFSVFNLNVEHPIPAAWDYEFSKNESKWVEVTLTSDKVIRGLYSDKSFASSDAEYRDIYIEELYVKIEGVWKKVERTAGVWISPSEIRYIKFYRMED